MMHSARTARLMLPLVAIVMTPLAGQAASIGLRNGGGSISAVQKVVQMLQDMALKAKQSRKAEEVSFAQFSTWCAQEVDKLKRQTGSEAQEIQKLSADVGKLSSDVQTLGDEITGLQSTVASQEADVKAQAAQREKDHAAFLLQQKDYSESVDALERAMFALQKQDFDHTDLLQVAESQALPVNAQQMISAFLGMMKDSDMASQEPNYAAYASPEANAYELHSHGILDMLKRLRDDFKEKLAECQQQEMNSKHAHEMMAQDLTYSIETAKEIISTTTAKKQEKSEHTAQLKGELVATEALKAEDEKLLSDTQVQCNEKTLSFNEKQTLRTEEIQALEKAIEVLSSEDVQGAAMKHLSLADSDRTRVALLHVAHRGSSAADTEGIRQRVRDFLSAESQRLHSKGLGLLVESLAVDPFTKVKKMISEMLTRLLEEAHADADHEGFCDKELGTSRITRVKLSEDIDGITADVESGKAAIAGLTKDIAELTEEIAEISAATKQATELRSAEKAGNAATVEDAEKALTALRQAVAVLKSFYAKASMATGLLQVAPRKAPWGESQGVKMGGEQWESLANPGFKDTLDLGHKSGMQTFGNAYSGQQDEAGGVLAMLEVISSDFSILKADTESAEATSQATFKDLMSESKQNSAVKQKKVELIRTDKAQAESKLRDDIADLKFTQDKLLAAERYYERLKPQCLDQGMSYEDRSRARQEEIQSLKEALRILDGEDLIGS